MVCEVCHKNIATVHLTEIIDEKVAEMHLCQNCARTKAEDLQEQLSISDFLGGLVDIDTAKKKSELSIKCSSCGLTYAEFKKKGRLGCKQCYLTFKQPLLSLLKKIHGVVKHTGKSPFRIEEKVSQSTKIKELQDRLERAVQLEEYEEAAHLRDEIKKAENIESSI